MESTGCKNCDVVQKLTGDKAAMCNGCWIAKLDWEIEQNQKKIKELKEKQNVPNSNK